MRPIAVDWIRISWRRCIICLLGWWRALNRIGTVPKFWNICAVISWSWVFVIRLRRRVVWSLHWHLIFMESLSCRNCWLSRSLRCTWMSCLLIWSSVQERCFKQHFRTGSNRSPRSLRRIWLFVAAHGPFGTRIVLLPLLRSQLHRMLWIITLLGRWLLEWWLVPALYLEIPWDTQIPAP